MSLPKLFTTFETTTVAQSRERFDNFEQSLFEFPQLSDEDYELKEYKLGNLYARQITIKKGVSLTGRVYRQDHLEIMLEGDILIASADGGVTHYEGHNVIEAKAGKRQAGFALADTIWLTINSVPNAVKENLAFTSVQSFDEYYKFVNNVNRLDYNNFLAEYKLTDEQVRSLADTDDLIDLPKGFENLKVSTSNLEGMCVKSSIDIEEGEVIGPVRLGNNRTILGKYCNHALLSNTKFELINDVFTVLATRRIPAGEEITMNYRDVLRYRASQEDLCQVG